MIFNLAATFVACLRNALWEGGLRLSYETSLRSKHLHIYNKNYFVVPHNIFNSWTYWVTKSNRTNAKVLIASISKVKKRQRNANVISKDLTWNCTETVFHLVFKFFQRYVTGEFRFLLLSLRRTCTAHGWQALLQNLPISCSCLELSFWLLCVFKRSTVASTCVTGDLAPVRVTTSAFLQRSFSFTSSESLQPLPP